MSKVVDRLLSLAERVSYFGGHLAGIALLAAIAALITLEVILRYIFNTSTQLADEFSAYFFVGLLYLGAAYALRTNRHITITVLANRLSRKYRSMLHRLVAALNLAIILLLTWQGYSFAIYSFQHDTKAPTVAATPLFLPMIPMALGLTVLAIQAVAEVLRTFFRYESVSTGLDKR